MKIRKEAKFSRPIVVDPGDTLQLHYEQEFSDGTTKRNLVLEERIGQKGVYTHGVIFETEGEFDEHYGLGGAFLNK